MKWLIKRNTISLSIFVINLVLASISFGARCNKLLTLIKNTSPVFKFHGRTPSKNRYKIRAMDIGGEVRSICEVEAFKFGLDEKQTEKVSHKAAIIAVELFTNAVMWGNKFDSEKFVTVEVFSTARGLTISVSDEGQEPFNPFNDPGSYNEGAESYDEFIQRRSLGRKPIVELETEGLFWLNHKVGDSQYFYHFENGSRVGIKISWRFF